MTNDKMRHAELANFLKTRREKTLPEHVGLSTSSRRRTPGLRREEVAQLAGISLTWYTWLEQGRDIQVSTQVIESLSRVLLLDKQEQRHLHLLANQPLPTSIPCFDGTISRPLQHFLDSLHTSPSLVTDQRWNVVAWNKAAVRLLGDFSIMNEQERNIIWSMFTVPQYKTLFIHWEMHAKIALARFRASFGQHINDPWLTHFVDALKSESTEFSTWWSLHEVQQTSDIYKALHHPIVGRLEFEVTNFDVSDDSGLKLIVHTPLQETDTTEKMIELMST